MMEEADAALVTRARKGDHDAFGVLVRRHSRPLFHLAYRMTGIEQDAEDVVQETFLRAYRQLGRFETRAEFGTWLHRIAVNCSFDVLRKRQRQDEQSEALGQEAWQELMALSMQPLAPDAEALNLEMKQQVAGALDILTPTERAAFVLRHFEEKSIQEIAETLGVGSSAAKQSIFRAMQKLRRTLAPTLAAPQVSLEQNSSPRHEASE